MAGVNESTKLAEVYVVNKLGEADGLHVFVDERAADRFAAACEAAHEEILRTTEPAHEEILRTTEPIGDPERLIAAQRGDALEEIGWPAAAEDLREGAALKTVHRRIRQTGLPGDTANALALLEQWAQEDEEA